MTTLTVILRCFLFGFFNLFSSLVWVTVLTILCRGLECEAEDWKGFATSLFIVIPFTLIGIGLPIYLSLFMPPVQRGIFIFVTIVLPYLFRAIRLNCPTRWGGDEEFNDVRETPCFSCLRRNIGGGSQVRDEDEDEEHQIQQQEDEEHQAQNEGEEHDQTQMQEDEENQAQHEHTDEIEHLEDSRIIYKKVVQGDGKLLSHNMDSSFRSRHPKSNILVNQPKKSKDDNNSNRCDIRNKPLRKTRNIGRQLFDEETFFPIQIPTDTEEAKEKSIHPWDEVDEEDVSRSIDSVSNSTDSVYSSIDSVSNSIDSVSNSIQLCTICLEEYKVGEEIGWSRNSECHHAFHKDCIIKWLENNDDCPICRKKY